MGFDNDKFDAPATRGHIGGIALTTSIALDNVIAAFEKLQADPQADIGDEISEMRRRSADLFARFKYLTGWSSPE